MRIGGQRPEDDDGFIKALSRHQGVRGGGDDRVDLRGQLVSLDQDFDEVIINLPRRIEAAFEITEQR